VHIFGRKERINDKRVSATEGQIVGTKENYILMKWSGIEGQRSKETEQFELCGVRRALSC
jgi:hypothetical protein